MIYYVCVGGFIYNEICHGLRSHIHRVHQPEPPSKSLQNIAPRIRVANTHIRRLIWRDVQSEKRDTKVNCFCILKRKHLAERKQHANATLAVNESIVVAYRGFNVIRSVFYLRNMVKTLSSENWKMHC